MKAKTTQTKADKRVKGFQVIEQECIWMKAGVINFRICDSAYDCNHCAFDKAMRRAMGTNRPQGAGQNSAGWAGQLQKRYSGADRPCRHVLTGRVDAPKICPYNYECYHCAYDQMLDDMDIELPSTRPRTILAGGYQLAQDYYYHLGHSWLRIEHGGRGRVGLDDFAVSLFGVFKELELPPIGSVLKQDEVGWAFRRADKEAAVLAPAGGTVLAVNSNAQEHPEILFDDPYHGGWLFMIEPDQPRKNLKKLYFGEQSRHWMELEGQRLLSMLGPEYESLQATGVRAIRDVVGNLPKLGWDELADRFLRTKVH